MDVDAAVGQRFFQRIADLGFEVGEQAFLAFDHADLHTEAAERLAELEADNAATEHDHRGG